MKSPATAIVLKRGVIPKLGELRWGLSQYRRKAFTRPYEGRTVPTWTRPS